MGCRWFRPIIQFSSYLFRNVLLRYLYPIVQFLRFVCLRCFRLLHLASVIRFLRVQYFSFLQFMRVQYFLFLRLQRVQCFRFLQFVSIQYLRSIQFVSSQYFRFLQFVSSQCFRFIQFVCPQDSGFRRFVHLFIETFNLVELYTILFNKPFVELFVTYVFPVVEFFMPITVTSIVLWLVLRPNHVLPQVDAAVMINFKLTNATSVLDYDIQVDLSFHNSHKYVNAQYLDLSSVVFYGGTRLGLTVDVLPVFVQRPNATNAVHAVFQGSAARLSPTAAQLFTREAADGFFNVLVTVASTFMYDLYVQKAVYYYDHECYIRFPAPHDGKATGLTPGTLCNAIAR